MSAAQHLLASLALIIILLGVFVPIRLIVDRRKRRRRLSPGALTRCHCGATFRNLYAAYNHAHNAHGEAEDAARFTWSHP